MDLSKDTVMQDVCLDSTENNNTVAVMESGDNTEHCRSIIAGASTESNIEINDSLSTNKTFTITNDSEDMEEHYVKTPHEIEENLDNGTMVDVKTSAVGMSTTNQFLNADNGDLQSNYDSKLNIFGNDSLPQWYNVRGTYVSPPVITKNFVKAFEGLPIYGKPNLKAELDNFQNEKLREFIGCNLDDEEFEELSNYCSPEHLKTGNEIVSETSLPTADVFPLLEVPQLDSDVKLNILKKVKLRMNLDKKNQFNTKLKYRGVRLLPQFDEDEGISIDTELEPGKDVLYHVRVYRPYACYLVKERSSRSRHSVFSFDMILSGRQYLTALRDRIQCSNDMSMRVDVSHEPEAPCLSTAKEMFPSGFLFINNVFYIDTRTGCKDHSDLIREWALKRGIGIFTKKDMCQVKLDDITVKMGYPEVYMHQGNCEHVFIFSEIRLMTPRDPFSLLQYPFVPSVSQNHIVYCSSCAEFNAKWLVLGSKLVPFNPAFMCDVCFKLYMYKDGEKNGEFKAYSYMGNSIVFSKPE